MKTSGARLASLFHQVGLIGENEWKKYFQKSAAPEKRLVDVLVQDVSWQTFADLAKLEIRLPSRKRRARPALPAELTQAIHIRRGEILELLEKHRPDLERLCDQLVGPRSDLASTLEQGDRDPYRELLDREILTPEMLSEIVQKGKHPAARRNREILAVEILHLNGFVPEDTRKHVAAQLGKPGFSLARELAKSAEVSSARIAEATARGMELPTVELAEISPGKRAREFCPVEFIRRELFLPFEVDGVIRLATSDPLNLSIADAVAILTGRTMLLCYAPPGEIIAALNRTFPAAAPPDAGPKPERRETKQPEAPVQVQPKPQVPSDTPQKVAAPRPAEPVAKIVDTMSTVQLVSSMIESAVATRATDIHLEPQAKGLRVRYRIDGQLHNVMNVPPDMSLPVISRIKVLSNMNVTERRRPQDGHFALQMENRPFDFRVSAMPSHLGEKLVLRILDETTVLKGLAELGLTEAQQRELARLISRPFGLLLVTGPTGSGKTTTLYSALSTINSPNINITTIEDPVEYQLEGITQVQVDYAIDLDFASGLRSALRQDPDVIMVGEIRDSETARIAIRAALTGHMVFSTLHTNTAVSAAAALGHMAVPPYLIASALAGVVAQRLVKKICAECRHAIRPPKGLKRDLGLDESSQRKMYRGKGCSACLNTGYSGRTGVFEILRVTEALRRLIVEQAGDEQIAACALEQGFRTLREHAMDKVSDGITSPDEILRTVFLSE